MGVGVVSFQGLRIAFHNLAHCGITGEGVYRVSRPGPADRQKHAAPAFRHLAGAVFHRHAHAHVGGFFHGDTAEFQRRTRALVSKIRLNFADANIG